MWFVGPRRGKGGGGGYYSVNKSAMDVEKRGGEREERRWMETGGFFLLNISYCFSVLAGYVVRMLDTSMYKAIRSVSLSQMKIKMKFITRHVFSRDFSFFLLFFLLFFFLNS